MTSVINGRVPNKICSRTVALDQLAKSRRRRARDSSADEFLRSLHRDGGRRRIDHNRSRPLSLHALLSNVADRDETHDRRTRSWIPSCHERVLPSRRQLSQKRRVSESVLPDAVFDGSPMPSPSRAVKSSKQLFVMAQRS